MEPRQDAAQIRARLAELQGIEEYEPNRPLPGGQSASTPNTGTNNNALIAALTERLTQQGRGIATSSSSSLQQSINEAIAGTRQAGELGAQRLMSERDREVGFMQDRAAATYTGALEGRTGYATQVIALRELTETTEKEIKDLRQRYNEAIMANDAATAQRVADLEMKKLEYLQEQEQQFYSNLFSLANLREQEASRQQQASQFERGLTAEEQRFERQLGFDLTMFEKQIAQDERMELFGLAAEYGVEVGPNETIDSMINKISPFVDEKRRLELEAIRSDINASNAQAAQALSRTRQTGELDSDFVDAYALAYLQGDTALMVGLEETGQAGPVLQRVQEMRRISEDKMKEIAESSTDSEQFAKAVAADPDIIATLADVKRYQDLYGPDWRRKSRSQRRNSRGSAGSVPFNLGTEEQQNFIRTGVYGATEDSVIY